jgi:cytochrome oxidase assembly protein ShyY1
MAKKKWFGLAALGAAIAALVMRRKRERPAESTQGTIDT